MTDALPGRDPAPDLSSEEVARNSGLPQGMSRTNRVLILSAVLVVLALIARSCV